MRQSVTVVTAPAQEPLTLGEVKAWAKIDGTDEDALLASLLTAGIQSAEEYLRRRLISTTLRLSLDCSSDSWMDNLPAGVYDMPVTVVSGGLPSVIKLPFPPVASVSSVVTYDVDNMSATFAASNYLVDVSGRLALNYGASWPSNLRSVNSVEITYVAGYGSTSAAVPAPIKTAILMHVQKMYDGRMVCELPEGCEQMLRQYRVYG